MWAKVSVTAFALLVGAIGISPVHAGSLAQEHKKAKAGGYEKQLKQSIEKNGGTRLKQKEQQYQSQQKQKQQQSRDTPDKYGKAYVRKQLGVKRIRSW